MPVLRDIEEASDDDVDKESDGSDDECTFNMKAALREMVKSALGK